MPINGNGSDNVLLGTPAGDEINGRGGDDILFGFGGNDSLSGGAGNDILYGGAGQDQLFGGQGDDVLDGGAGADILDGGQGDDILTGGGGADRFVFSGHFGGDIITDFQAGQDIIDLTSFASITNISQLSFYSTPSGVVVSVPHSGGSSFVVAGATLAQVQAAIQVACVLGGTQIQTPAGDVAVEKLSIGDLVTTIDGSAKPIRWIGTRGYAKAFVEANKKVTPVLFSTGSLGKNVPSSDLYVSPEHAIFVDHVLVPAELLVNGTSIRQISDRDTVEYFHIEFEEPQVIFTNGAPTESYVDHGNRMMFENAREFGELYGDVPADAPLSRQRRFYSIYGGAALDAIRDRLSVEAVQIETTRVA